MMITKIELKDITSHKQTTIEFQRGLNVLLGQNGTGKSTVLNMIGYNLFDFLPGSQKEHLRNDSPQPKSGSINLWIIGTNDDEFVIKRTLGRKSNIIEVEDAKTGVTIRGVNNKSSLQEWLKQQVSLKKEFDLGKIFNTSIGVQQGTFTAPFLQPARYRKSIFDPILQVDTYRKVWQNILEIIKKNNEQIYLYELEAREIAGILVQKVELGEEKESVSKQINDDKSEETEFQKELNDITDKYDDLKDLKSKIEEITKKYEQSKLKKEALITFKDKIENDIKNATQAQLICKKNETDYNTHKDLIVKEQQLQSRFEQYQLVIQKKNVLDRALAEIESSNEFLTKQIMDIEKAKKDNYDNLQKVFEDHQTLQMEIEKSRESVTLLNAQEEQLNQIRANYTDLSIDIDNREKILIDLPDVEKLASKFDEFQDKLKDLENKQIKFETEINQDKINKQKSKGGNCPLLNTKCKNINENSLELFFEKRINENIKLLEPISKKIANLEDDFEKNKKAQEKLEHLQKLEIENNTLKNQKLDLGKDIQRLKTEVKRIDSEEKDLKSKIAKKTSLDEKVNQYQYLKHDIEINYPKLFNDLKKSQEQMNPLIKQLKPLEIDIQKDKDVEKNLNLIKKQMIKTRESYSTYQQNVKISENLPELNKELEKNQEQLDKIISILANETTKKEKLDSQFSESDFTSTENKLKELNNSIKILEGKIKINRNRIIDIESKLKSLEKKEKELEKIDQDLENLTYLKSFIETIRNLFDEVGPKITEALLNRINGIASEIYRGLMDNESIQLIWERDYNIKILTTSNEKDFRQLSGGEQMVAALAVRLAILKILTNVDFAFFDEPTINLDKERRINLAKCIQNIKGFQQLFVISHDDTFEENADNVIKFSKDENQITNVQYFSK